MSASSAAGGQTAEALRSIEERNARVKAKAVTVPAQIHGRVGERELSEFEDEFSAADSQEEDEEDHDEEEDDVTSSDEDDEFQVTMRNSQQEEPGQVQQPENFKNYGSGTFIEQDEKRIDDGGLGPGALASEENKLTQTA